MNKGSRLAVAALIVLAAACVAIPLRKDDTQSKTLPQTPVSATPEIQRLPTKNVLSIGTSGDNTSKSPAANHLESARSGESPSGTMPKLSGLGATLHAPRPELPASFPGFSEPGLPDQGLADGSDSPSLPVAQSVPDDTLVVDAPLDQAPSVEEQEPEKSPLTYRIIDGDTLEKIAQRLLGDATRSNEIYAANRDTLDGPDLLPIGLELVIPSDEPITSPVEQPASQSSSPQIGGGLLPIPPIGS